MKKRNITYFVLGLFMALAFLSCKKEKPAPPVYIGYDYFPNNAGHWIIYRVDSMIVPFSSNTIDTFHYYIKEVIDSFYTNNLGQRTQVIERYKATNLDSAWVYQKSWTGNLTSTEALRTEDGIKYVKLLFPVTANTAWNGGAFSSNAGANAVFPDWNQSSFYYLSVNTPMTLNNQYFDSTLIVIQDTTPINSNFEWHQFYIEEYATNIGRIYKGIINLFDPNLSLPDPITGQDSLYITSDFIYLAQKGELQQGSLIYTETYVSSGN
ncbi:MAG: hypothetical protein ACLQQ4_05655 [Bacteroidia bacterium]